MASNDYHFVTHWRVEGELQEVAELINDPMGLKRWWPSVYLDVVELEPGDETGLGQVIDLYTKGWLPYTLRWQFRKTEITPTSLSIEATGDFNGRGIWTLAQNGPYVDIVYDWKISADKPVLRDYSFIMKPIFAANHVWAMSKGEESLKLELARRRASTPEEHARIPAPPPPTTSSPIPLLLGAAGGIFFMWWILKSIFRGSER